MATELSAASRNSARQALADNRAGSHCLVDHIFEDGKRAKLFVVEVGRQMSEFGNQLFFDVGMFRELPDGEVGCVGGGVCAGNDVSRSVSTELHPRHFAVLDAGVFFSEQCRLDVVWFGQPVGNMSIERIGSPGSAL